MTIIAAGIGEYHVNGQMLPFQFEPVSVSKRISVTDWITNVLEPIGWNKFVNLSFSIPTVESAGFSDALRQLENVNSRYLQGDDRGVLAAAYDAIDPVMFSQRQTLLQCVSNPSKRAAIDSLIETAHRFFNGGRHVPEERRTRGGFEVDHIDGEYARLLSGITGAYLAKRLESVRPG